METKHTPGPWKLIEQGDANMYGMVTAGNRWIISFQQNGELMSETQLANAKLMAAAPELLSTLKHCTEALKVVCSSATKPFIERAEAAIKKATE